MSVFPKTDGVSLDGDDPEHIQWIFQKSVERASQYNIRGVTYRLTQGELVNRRDCGIGGDALWGGYLTREYLEIAIQLKFIKELWE